jgi:Cof subfamily protein (haloacid dehalogenase superfamily)
MAEESFLISVRKALIALDIDGTLAPMKEPIPAAVAEYLNGVMAEGHQIVFLTGRTFTFARPMLKLMREPFYLAVQNGAAVVELPSKKVVYSKYLSKDILGELDRIFEGASNDYLIEGGVEEGDHCFYRSQRHTEEQLEYIRFRYQLSKENWIDTPSFQEAGIEAFPLIKCFGEKTFVDRIAQEINRKLDLHMPVILDPFKEKGYIAMGTHPQVSKGQSMQALQNLLGSHHFLIAAGDDNNDESMIEAADFGIAMETSPESVLAKADFIAPSAKKQGIIPALNTALKLLNESFG